MASYEHSVKRQRTDDGPGALEQTDKFKPPPSPCVHVRSLSEQAIEGDLVEAVQHFGQVRDVMMMPGKRQALVEFENIQGAKNCVEYSQSAPIYCAGAPAYFNYSTSQKIKRTGESEEGKPPNHVLLMTILNPQYSISVDVIQKIASPYGQVQRIVIFKKNGIQAMVEFDSVDSAQRAKQNLNGADIYSGCCTLKIEFAKPTRLNVVRNNEDSWDYTNPSLGGGKDNNMGGGRGQPLLQEPRFGAAPAPYNGPASGAQQQQQQQQQGYGGGFGGPGGGYYDDQQAGYDGFNRGGPNGPFGQGDRYGQRGPGGQTDRFGRPINPMEGAQGSQGAVIMVYGLNMEKMNCERVFNLFCLYGNVVRVKFLKSKEGSAMIQLGDPVSCERAIANLNNCFFHDNKLSVGLSKQAFLQEVFNPHDLPDGTPSYKDYMGNRNNRFTNPEAAQKNRIQSPSKALHFFNAPPSTTEADLTQMFENVAGKTPSKIKQFPSKSERSCTGLVEFENKSDAIEALIMVNHHPINSPGAKSPFIFKLCFSTMPLNQA